MNTKNAQTVLVVCVAAAVVLMPSRGHCQDLEAELRQLDKLRNGANTPFPAVERIGAELLSKYRDSADQGRILYQLAHVYAQTGQARPDRTIHHATRAIQQPLDSEQRLRAHIYLGDAVQVADKKKRPEERRKGAAVHYLKGFREAQLQNLPEKAPELPGVFVFDALPREGPVYEAMQRKYDQSWAARKEAERQCALVALRDVLARQLIDLYGQPPFATDEFRALAKETLKDDAVVEKLVTQVSVRVAEAQKRIDAVMDKAKEQLRHEGRLSEPESSSKSAAVSRPSRWWLALAGGGLVVLGGVFAWFRRRARRAGH